ncbi:glucose-6-phosphate isomerase [Campylobacter sp. 19-13652]|uniref:glucose-6-phosphate isomerase n=1 Tax=Campylobacter sp. 19-13652 TaxID=2840180 RepID=UPI001C787D2A|nr:glucose-6-phosphate isomerase [Campylobacter sp. 19-13652]BCX79085.1 putative glucose-6-phosphate isomerase [Campylobacter sp. 19-13652]
MVKTTLKFNTAKSEHIAAYAARVNDEYEKGEVGYYHLPSLSASLLPSISELNKSLGSGIDTVVLVGVGGSALGVRAIEFMLPECLSKELKIIDNLDEVSIRSALEGVNFNSTLFIISSKSGTTLETITIFKYILNKFKPNSLKDNFIFITDKGTPLDDLASKNGARVFFIPHNVGGRFSVLSAIGLVPLGLCGVDIAGLLEGAKACAKRYIDDGDMSLIAKAHHYATHRHARINVIFSYSDRFEKFNEWYVQLWAESLGKRQGHKRVGLTPVGLIGSKDQHSFLQLIMDGAKDKSVTFLRIKEHIKHGLSAPNVNIDGLRLEDLAQSDFAGNFSVGELLNLQADATTMALVQEGLSVDEIELDRLDEWHIGWLIYYYELLTSATGILLGINPYDQPAVEIGKRILRLLAQKRNLS